MWVSVLLCKNQEGENCYILFKCAKTRVKMSIFHGRTACLILKLIWFPLSMGAFSQNQLSSFLTFYVMNNNSPVLVLILLCMVAKLMWLSISVCSMSLEAVRQCSRLAPSWAVLCLSLFWGIKRQPSPPPHHLCQVGEKGTKAAWVWTMVDPFDI